MKIEELHELNMKRGEITCHLCKETYTIDPESNHNAIAEAKATWGDHAKKDDQVTLCDDCFNKVRSYYQTMN